jgi:hypothetical protein
MNERRPLSFITGKARIGSTKENRKNCHDAVGVSSISLLLFFAGMIVGLLQLFQLIEFGVGFEMVAIADNLAKHGAFANPFHILSTGPTAVEPPLYPFFLAILIKLWKQPPLIMLVAIICNICVNSVVAALLPRISLCFYDDQTPGLAAGVLWLLSVRLMPSWDASYTVLGLILFCLFSAWAVQIGGSAATLGALSGLIAGCLFLLNSSSILISLPWIGYLLVCRTAPSKQMVAYCCSLLAVAFLIASVWILRNAYELGAPVVRTNLGMTLYASNNDCAKSSLIEDERQGCYQSHHPHASTIEARLLVTLGEVGYDRKRVADARNWMISNPFRFLQLTCQRIREFWFPPVREHAFFACMIWVITALSIPGLILMAWDRQMVTLFSLVALSLYPLMYYVVVSDIRYRYPILWVSTLCAGYCVRSLPRLAKYFGIHSAGFAKQALR